MGVARLSKVTIISPRSEYEDVAKALANFEEFHPLEGAAQNFDPGVQELTVKAVKLFAQADQTVKDLGLKLMPGQMDIVFRGVKIPRSTYEASTWEELLNKADAQLGPISEEVRGEKVLLQKAQKDEADSEALMGALKAVSGFSSDLTGLSDLKRFKAAVSLVENEKVGEFSKSLPEAMFLSQPITKEQTLVMVAVAKAEEAKLDKTMKLLELKPLTIPPNFPQNPAEAYSRASQDHGAAITAREKAEVRMAESRDKHGTDLLALRELSEVSRKTLDEARVSGGMQRLAMISGYVPTKKEAKLKELFGRWIVHAEPVERGPDDGQVPALMENGKGLGLYQPITLEQGLPAVHEVDPTPLVSFVFPIFFGMMFGDVGHGLVLTAFMLLVRQRSTGNMRWWANMFIVAGMSAIVFGIIFGEFFELSFFSFVPIPPLVEIIHRAAGAQDTFSNNGVYTVMEVAILVGVFHLLTALGLDVYQGTKERNRLELWLGKIPVFTMYVGGVLYGLAFVGLGFTSFDVLISSAPAPLIGIPNNVLGAISLALLVPSMVVLLAGKAVAISTGKVIGSVAGALSNGGLEVFERISQFMSNTISYVRLAVMLLVHAGLLLITNQYFGPSGIVAPWPEGVPIWVILNIMIIAFEAFIVYVQDLRLHLYEFFTKFYTGTGKPFRKIFPDRVRVRINWL